MNNIDNNWKIVPLSSISQIYNGNSINKSTKQAKYTGLLEGRCFIATKDISFDGVVDYENGVKIPFEETTFKTAPAGSVLVCSEGGSAGRKSAYITQEVCFGNKLYAIVNKNNSFVGKYVYYYTRYRGFFEQFKGLLNGIIGGVSSKNFGSITIPLPSVPEQERIVSRIEELFSQLDASVAELQAAKKRLKVYRQAVLKEAFLGNLTKNCRYNIDIDLEWSLENETKFLPTIPSEWRYISLSKLGNLGRGKSKHRPRNDAILFENGKYPFIQTGDIKSANKANNNVTTYSKMYGDYGLQQSKLWPKGTLCITIAANIAETAFLGIDACFPDSVVGFTAYDHVLPTYIKYFIESEKIRLWAFAPATAQKNINLDTLENLIVPYCSLKEQQKVIDEIESRFSVCDSIEQTVDTALQQAEALRQSILKQAFEGKL